MTEQELIQQELEWEEQKKLLERQFQLESDKESFMAAHKKKRKLSTSKILVFFLLINGLILEFFTGWVTVRSIQLAQYSLVPLDFTPLVTMIGIILGEVAGFAVYAAKSTKENTVGGIVYEQAMAEHPQG